MKLVTIYIILFSNKCVQACRTDISKNLDGDGKESFLDFKNWQFPPDNYDWEGFVNLLGTRGVKNKSTEGTTTTERNSMEDEKYFPWPGLGAGQSAFKPPPESKIKSYIGQSSSCFHSYSRGNGSMRYKRFLAPYNVHGNEPDRGFMITDDASLWYYNAYKDQCLSFVYRGNGGNTNRYLTKWHCNENCRKGLKAPCVPDTLFNYAAYLERPDLTMPT